MNHILLGFSVYRHRPQFFSVFEWEEEEVNKPNIKYTYWTRGWRREEHTMHASARIQLFAHIPKGMDAERLSIET